MKKNFVFAGFFLFALKAKLQIPVLKFEFCQTKLSWGKATDKLAINW